MEGAAAGTLSHVVTHSGIREWTFYVADVVVAGACVEAALDASPDVPVSLSCDGDPGWQEHRTMLDELG